MKKISLALVLVLAAVGCHASVRVEAKTAPPPEPVKVAEPAPVKEEPKAGEQIALPDQIEFEIDQARIKQTPKTLQTLDALADLMKKHPNVTRLRIEGHTDNLGTKKHNEKLSKARAEAVAKWLGDHQIESQRLVTVGYGARKPIRPNDNEANRSQNRRTEYYFEEVDGKKIDGDTKSVETPARVASSGTSAGGKGGAQN